MIKLLCLLLVICIPFSSLSGYVKIILVSPVVYILISANNERADKDEIFRFVCENEEELLKAIENENFSQFENNGFIKSIKVNGDHVDFSCGGTGIGSATSYVGFYYSPNDELNAIWCAPPSAQLLTPNKNGFEWKETNGDNRYYTQHICGHFYYYKASF